MSVIIKGIENNLNKIAGLLSEGNIGVIPTDTLYGFSCNFSKKDSIENIYKIKGRDENKPFIILISDIKDLNFFNIKLNSKTKEILNNIWPNKVSVILPCDDNSFSYIHRGTNHIAFRIPKDENLGILLNITGPLTSTSVNLHGQEALTEIEEIKKQFGGKVDFIVDEGNLVSKPTTIIMIENEKVSVVRQGEFIVPAGMLK